jgi:PncC family amidohydrolase
MTSDAVHVGALLKASGDVLSTAESCTGGRIAASVTDISGASSWYLGGWVTYSNAMKISQLGVPEEMLLAHGAVSEQVAAAMCEGAKKKSGATVALSTTGVAGPTGGTDEKPVGTVFIGCATEQGIEVRKCLFAGTRNQVQEQAARAALQLLHEKLS